MSHEIMIPRSTPFVTLFFIGTEYLERIDFLATVRIINQVALTRRPLEQGLQFNGSPPRNGWWNEISSLRRGRREKMPLPQYDLAVRRFYTWGWCNAGVILLPLLMRGGVQVFEEQMPVFRLEELYLCALFLTASAIGELWVHVMSFGSDSTPTLERMTHYSFGLMGGGAFLALVYGLAFSGNWPLVPRRLVFLWLLMVLMAMAAWEARLLVLRDMKGRFPAGGEG